MDWWRAKLLLLIAFAFLDVFLGWQVKRLWVPRGPAVSDSVMVATSMPAVSVPPMGALGVTSEGWQESDLALLPGAVCTAPAERRATALNFTCQGSGGATLSWYNGLLLYSDPSVHAASGPTALADARGLLGRLSPSPLVSGSLIGGWDAATATGTYTLWETYRGYPLFNGSWRVSVGARGLTAQRWWLDVKVLQVLTPTPVVGVQQAEALLPDVYGTNVRPSSGGVPTLGYYYPTRAPGQQFWLEPVWRISVLVPCRGRDVSMDVYVDALAGAAPQANPPSLPTGAC